MHTTPQAGTECLVDPKTSHAKEDYCEVTAWKTTAPLAGFLADLPFFGFAVSDFTMILPPAAEKALTN